jgi:UDPglucose 6-dehydrogenase
MKAIVGYGIVGRATHDALLDHEPVDIYDVKNIEMIVDHAYDQVFVCTPTADQDDLDQLTGLLRRLANNCGIIVVRSTVPVGFFHDRTPDLLGKICYCPEFLRERYWKTDSRQNKIVVGHDADIAKFESVFSTKHAIFMTIHEATILKMMCNSYAALRVVFANHVYAVSQAVGANYQNIYGAFQHVNQRDQDYLDVHESLRGFGGKCLPKDLDFLIATMQELQLPQSLLTSIQQDNTNWPITVRSDT